MRPESSQAAHPGHAPAGRAAQPGPGSGALAPRLAILLVLLCLLVAAWLLWRLTGFEYGLDQGIYATVADVMLHGGAPYRDAWDFKPPGVFFAYALAKGALGDSMRSVRVLEALGFASLVWAFALYARRFAGSVWPGLLGGALAVGGHVWLGFWQTAQPESFGAVLLAWALVLATVDPGSPRKPAADAGAAALYTLAALLKPPLGGGILVSFAFALRRSKARGRTTLCYALGGALPLLLCLSYFAAKGALPDLYEALFVFAPGYTALNYGAGDLPGFLVRTLKILFLHFSALNAPGLLLLFALPKLAPREREGALHVLGVLFFCLLGVALQGRFFAYHFGAAVPLLSLLAGWGLFKLTRLLPRRAIGVAGLAAALLLTANLSWLERDAAFDAGPLARIRELDAGQAWNAPLRRVAAWLRENTPEGAPIHVFGFQPVLYDWAGRPPASRFIYDAAQRAPWYRTRGRDLLMQDLLATPPAAILVEHGDVHPGTAATALDSAATLERFTRLRALIARDYDPGVRVESFTIHLRREDPGAPNAPAPPSGRE